MTTIDTINRRRVSLIVDGATEESLWHEELAIIPSKGANLAVQRMFVDEKRAGVPVVLVHGFAQNRYTWHISERSMQVYLAARGFDVWNLELRGHGRSREYGSASASHFDEYLDDMQTVSDAIGEPAFAIGHSLGGAVIVGAATRIEFRGLVPIAGVYGFATNERVLNRITAASLSFERLARRFPVSVNTKLLAPILTKNLAIADLWGYGLPASGWVPGSVEFHLLRERVEHGFDWTSMEVWMEMCRIAQSGAFPYEKQFRENTTPLFVVLGDQDALLGVADGMRCLHESAAVDKQATVYNAFDHGCHWGHLDLILGKSASQVVWPDVADWMSARL